MAMAPLAALKRGLRKNRMSSIGWSVWSSQATNAPSNASPTANPARIAGAVQPCDGASITAHRKVASPAIDSSAPIGSSGGADGSRESGTSIQPPIRAMMTTGTLTRNTEPQKKWESRKPPAIGPRPTPSADTPAHTPIALERSAGSVKTLEMMLRVAGMISAPPIPMNARVAISTPADPDSALASDPVPKITRPAVSALYRPNRSPSDPAVSSRPAKTRVYESTIHCSELVDACRTRPRVGIATFRMVLSRPITIRLTHTTINVSHR